MGERFWIQDFETGLDRLRVHFTTDRGQVVAIIVIQYEAYIDGKWRPVVRFDETHGFFHRDVVSPSGEQQKTPIAVDDRSEALAKALYEIRQLWRTYRKTFEDEYDASKQPEQPHR
ncbi:hypothetical protein HUU05_10355 [candidate division KSB1 bacterium]|nr:hypothetical protein [candidate division KSB1 bacterium]